MLYYECNQNDVNESFKMTDFDMNLYQSYDSDKRLTTLGKRFIHYGSYQYDMQCGTYLNRPHKLNIFNCHLQLPISCQNHMD